VADLAFDIQSVSLGKTDELVPVWISSTTGLPSRALGQETNDSRVRIRSHVDIKEDIISLKRVFEPISGVDHEEVPDL
jgi:hypothetical protein